MNGHYIHEKVCNTINLMEMQNRCNVVRKKDDAFTCVCVGCGCVVPKNRETPEGSTAP